jgi:hypothetical protein
MTHRLRSVPVLVFAAVLALVGCVPVGTQVGPRTIECADVSSAACSEQADRLAATAGGPVSSITVECRVAACTRAGGAGVARITLTDGRTLDRTWSYVGDPNPLPVPICIGIALDQCKEQVMSVLENVSPAHHLVSVTVTCKQRCDRSKGEVDIVFRSADGSTDQMGSGWASAP